MCWKVVLRFWCTQVMLVSEIEVHLYSCASPDESTKDFICNHIGNLAWTLKLPWSGQDEFVSAPFHQFIVDGKQAGTIKGKGNFVFLKIEEAGHMVPYDRPRAAREMMERWMRGDL